MANLIGIDDSDNREAVLAIDALKNLVGMADGVFVMQDSMDIEKNGRADLGGFPRSNVYFDLKDILNYVQVRVRTKFPLR